jgi:thiosulfate/3-mercaptopyruvate sulfurtransferase
MHTFFRSLLCLLLFAPLAARAAITLPGVLVDVAWLAEHRREVVVLDIGNTPESYADIPDFFNDQEGRPQLLEAAGHITDAVLVDYESTRVDRQVNGHIVKKQAPDGATFQQLVRQWGIKRGDSIVIVPRGNNAEDVDKAARLLWVFRRYGEQRVALLDGGMLAWLHAGQPVRSERFVPPKPGDWMAAAERQELLATAEEVAAVSASSRLQLIDVRESADFAAGHIAGALSLPPELLLGSGDSKRFLTAADYRQLFRARGIDPDAPMIAYCKGGVLAPGAWLVLSEILGNRQVRVFEGAMQQWRLEQRPLSAP